MPQVGDIVVSTVQTVAYGLLPSAGMFGVIAAVRTPPGEGDTAADISWTSGAYTTSCPNDGYSTVATVDLAQADRNAALVSQGASDGDVARIEILIRMILCPR
jgi:hypothetical protein